MDVPPFANQMLDAVGSIRGDIREIRVQFETFQKAQDTQWIRHDQEVIIRRAADAALETEINKAKGGMTVIKYVLSIGMPVLYALVLTLIGYVVHEVISLHDKAIMHENQLTNLSNQRLEKVTPPGWEEMQERQSNMEQTLSELKGSLQSIAAKKMPSVQVTTPAPVIYRQDVYPTPQRTNNNGKVEGRPH